VLQVESPFDFARQSSVYVPKGMAAPQSSMHSQAVAELVAHAAQMLGGRTLVLTTTLRAMRAIGESLRSSFSASEQQCPQVWVQGQAPKRELMARFCNAAHSVRGGVLVASASFWEGVDIPGDALQLVVIDKLPFSPPDDPWLQARAQALEAEGKSAFMEMHLPQAAVMLKQGAGRLIRSVTDRGILVVCDARLSTMGYGKRLMAALPPMRRIQDNAEFLEALQLLTTTSTKDLPWS
jgi:ATP-dependent DNA helicase DinG